MSRPRRARHHNQQAPDTYRNMFDHRYMFQATHDLIGVLAVTVIDDEGKGHGDILAKARWL